MKRAILMATLALSACDDTIPGLCKVDSDCKSTASGSQLVCYEGVCIADDAGQSPVGDAGVLEDAGSPDATPGDGGAPIQPADAGPTCTPSAAHEVNCGDGIDDDCDGLIDCADPDCANIVCRAAVNDCDEAEKCTSGVCPADAKKSDGTQCTSSCNATCQTGKCIGTTSCDDQNPCTVDVCNSTTGQCSHSPVPDSSATSCNDGKACTTGDKCVGGACQGTVACTCDQCHVGQCKADGSCECAAASTSTPCNDGNKCTTSKYCDGAGTCGGVAVTCKASDKCHVAGVCDASTGCTNPSAPDGTGCGGTGQYCSVGNCSSGCLIDSTFYASGAARTGYPCQVCQPTSPTQWSNASDGMSCSSGSLPCYCMNGLAWSQVSSNTSSDLHGLWGASSSDIWAVGSAGTAMNWTGGAWSSTETPSGMILYDVWGSRASDVWAVGSSGTIFRWNGNTWSDSSIAGDYYDFNGIWGSDAKNVWIVGTEGIIRYWNGTSFSIISSGTNQILRWIWGTGPDNIWVVGDAGTVLHCSNGSWSSAAPTSGISITKSLQYVWGSAGETWTVPLLSPIASGNPSAYRWSGSGTSGTWTEFPLPIPSGKPATTATIALAGGWGTGTDVWIFGGAIDSSGNALSGLIFHWNGTTWSGIWSGSLFFYRPWADAQDFWVAGLGGVIVHATR